MKLTALFSVFLSLSLSAQQVAIKGTITDAITNEALPGANVQVKGTNRGTTADVNGNFSLEAAKGDVLIFSFISYIGQEITVAEQTTINVALNPDVQSLEEVVVVGYGTQKRTEVTGAITSVSSEALTAIPTGTLDQALQGRAAGVTVINNGAPGTAPTMRVRGINTVNNNDPLYVVDGVIASSIAGLNPNDIQSMEILKDASTTAIYGSQGSNGVIMITTKKGAAAAKSVVNFDAYFGTQWNNERYDVLNNEQYRQYATEAWGGAIVFNNPAYADRANGIFEARPQGGETMWQDEIFQKGKMENYNLSVSGGSESASFRISAGYLNQEGIFINTGFERYNIRANSDFKTGRLRIAENIGVSFSKQRPELNSGGRSIMEHAIKAAPYLPIHNYDNTGTYQGPNSDVDGQDAENPVRIMRLNHYELNTTSIIGDLSAELEIITGLKFKSLVGFESVKVLDDQFQPAYDDDNITSTHKQSAAIIRKNTANYNSILFTNSLTYTKTLADKHNFELLAVIENSEIKSKTQNISSQNSITSTIPQLTNERVAANSRLTEYGRIGYLGRLNYNFDQKYLFAASIRRDASSRFGANNRWGTFPSVALGWRLDKEAFMSNIAAISNLKLRASWGKAGNDKIGDYAYAATLTSNMYYVIGGLAAQGTTPNGSANPELKWEETTMTNIGVDLGLFENRFTLAAEYFINKSDDLLMPTPMANSIGDFQGNISQNAGSVESKGIELVLGYNDFEGDFQWSANLNLGSAKNEVKSLGAATVLSGGNFEGENLTRCEVGEPAFFFYGYTAAGVFDSDAEAQAYMGGSQYADGARGGDIILADVSGNGTIGPEDRGRIGNPFPKMTLGFDLNASYKGFDLNIFISGAYGQDIYNTNIWDLEGMDRLFNSGVKVLERWTPDNTTASIPRAGSQLKNLRPSTRFIDDGSYTRLKNVTLGYTIPSSLLKNKVSKLRVYVSGQNLLTLTQYDGLDPEIGANSVAGTGIAAVGGRGGAVNFSNGIDFGTYPMPKSFTAGLQLTF